jgi:hypothetical protein
MHGYLILEPFSAMIMAMVQCWCDGKKEEASVALFPFADDTGACGK